MLIKRLADYCDHNFKTCGNCGTNCTHPSGKCSGSCADCLREIQYHLIDGRAEYNCRNMLRYYTCHTAWKRCSEILYALETIDLRKYPEFRILSVGCGAAPDLMAFEQIADGRRVNYHGVDISQCWDEIHDFIEWSVGDTPSLSAYFDRNDIYNMFAHPDVFFRAI